MKIPDSCRELFLDGITDAYFYAARESSLPIPFIVQRVLQINGCKFAGEALHLALSEGDNYIVTDGITAKQTSQEGGNGTAFSFEITANIEAGKENIPEIIKNMHGKDYYIVLRKQDDSLYLCYTLPNTFAIADSVTNQNNAETRSVTATCKAMSEFIPITLS
nr:MAG TPA: hypothetical protein [Caudoviricetes sp.]